MTFNEFLNKTQELIADLDWERDRMSSSGTETLDELLQLWKIK